MMIINKSVKFLMLALDHRASFLKLVSEDRAIEVKKMIIEATAPYFSGVLVDKDYGLPALKQLETDKPFLLSIEKSGQDSLELESSVAEIKKTGAEGVKLLVKWDGNEEKIAVAKQVYEDCQKEEMPLFLEIVHSGEIKVLESVKRFWQAGVKADVFKLEYPGTGEECQLISEYLSDRPWIILTRGVGFEEFCQQLETAIIGGANGFLAGRALWADLIDSMDMDLLKDRFIKLVDIVNDNFRY